MFREVRAELKEGLPRDKTVAAFFVASNAQIGKRALDQFAVSRQD
jgi:hypothetical protein